MNFTTNERTRRIRMNRVLAVAALLILTLSLTAGCSKEHGQTSEAIRNDLVEYVKAENMAMMPWNAIPRLKTDLASSRTSDRYVSILKSAYIPLVTDVTAKMEAIRPKTDEVREIHTNFSASLKDYLAALHEMADAVEKNNSDLASKSSARLNAMPSAESEFQNSLKSLAAKNNLTIQ